MWLFYVTGALTLAYLVWRDRWLAKHARKCLVCGAKVILHRCPACGEPLVVTEFPG